MACSKINTTYRIFCDEVILRKKALKQVNKKKTQGNVKHTKWFYSYLEGLRIDIYIASTKAMHLLPMIINSELRPPKTGRIVKGG